MSGRELFAALHLLDRQLVDRDGRLCGNVDDLELTESVEGNVYVTAILSGPGALWYRLGRKRLGRWLRTHTAMAMPPEHGDDPVRIPMRRVTGIGSAVTLAAHRYELANNAAEIWVRDHIIGHIPGSRHSADE
jgi:sporulation protein YlmC with PRC-barrel domain